MTNEQTSSILFEEDYCARESSSSRKSWVSCWIAILWIAHSLLVNAAPSHNQTVLVGIVMSGTTDSRLISQSSSDELAFEQSDDLLFSAARQQYILGLQIAKLHQGIFSNMSFSNTKLISDSNFSSITSSQAFARGLMAFTQAVNLSNSYSDTWKPPGFSQDSGIDMNAAVPPGINILGSTTFANEEDVVLANYSQVCGTIEEDLLKFKLHYQASKSSLIHKFGDQLTTFSQLEEILLWIRSFMIKNNGQYPTNLNFSTEAWSRGAALNYLAVYHQQNEAIVRLISSQIYEHIEALYNRSANELSLGTPISPKALFLHVKPETFHYILALLNQTSRECISSDLENYFKSPNRESFAWSANCEGYAPAASVVSIALHPSPSIEYNGRRVYPTAAGENGSLETLMAVLRTSLLNKNLDYYCNLDPSSLTSSGEFYLLVYMLLAVLLLLVAISVYFVTVTRVKEEMITHQFQRNQKLLLMGVGPANDSSSARSGLFGNSLSRRRSLDLEEPFLRSRQNL